MSYLIDTDCVADFLKGRQNTVDFISGITSTFPAISISTFGELYEGIYYGQDPETAERGFLEFLNEFDVLMLDADIMRRFALIRGSLRRSGQLIGDTDLLIAATAIHFDLVLVSRNRKHFERIPDLQFLDGPSPL